MLERSQLMVIFTGRTGDDEAEETVTDAGTENDRNSEAVMRAVARMDMNLFIEANICLRLQI